MRPFAKWLAKSLLHCNSFASNSIPSRFLRKQELRVTCRCNPLTGAGSGSDAASLALSTGISMVRPWAPPAPGCASDCRLGADGRSGDCTDRMSDMSPADGANPTTADRQMGRGASAQLAAARIDHLALAIGAATTPEVAPHRPCNAGPPRSPTGREEGLVLAVQQGTPGFESSNAAQSVLVTDVHPAGLTVGHGVP